MEAAEPRPEARDGEPRRGTFSLVRGTAAVLAGTVGATLLGIVRIKLLALYTGSAGVGTLSVLMSLNQALIAVLGLLSGVGLVKYVSEYRAAGDLTRVRRLVESALTLQLIGALVIVLAGLIGIRPLVRTVAAGADFPVWYAAVVLLSVPLGLLTSLQLAVLKGYKAMGALGLVNVISAAISVAILVPLVRYWGVGGAVVSLAFDGLILCGVGYVFLRRTIRELGLRLFRMGRPDWPLVRNLLALGAAAQISAIAVSWSALYPRSFLIRAEGVDAVGLYQAGISLVGYAMVIRSSIATYFFSEISERGSGDRISDTINDTTRVALVLTTPAICILLVFLPQVIRILLTEEFLPVTGIALILLVTVWVSSQGAFMGQALMGQGKIKESVAVELSWCAIFLVLNAIMISRWGLRGAAMAYTGSFLLGFPITMAIAWRTLDYRPEWRNGVIAVTGLALIVASGIATSAAAQAAVLAATLPWAVFCLTRRERSGVQTLLTERAAAVGAVFGGTRRG